MEASSSKGRFDTGKRYSGKRTWDDGPALLERPHPLSLQMGPDVIFRNAIGDTEAQAMTEEWRPKFNVVVLSKVQEDSSWTF